MTKILLCVLAILLASTLTLGQAQYKVLWSFGSGSDGALLFGNLTADRVGNLYGTTGAGGATSFCTGCGTVFKLSANTDGTWTETILYSFCSGGQSCSDGAVPKAGLIFDASGNLYGTTASGGAHSYGTVFEVSPPPSPGDKWKETVLYSFCANYQNSTCLDGATPLSQLTYDTAGNLYGTTSSGGTGGTSGGCCEGGTVFELSPGATGWTETVLHNFCPGGGICADGLAPQAGVTFDKGGDLYGTTIAGGDYQGNGTVYKLSPGQNGWVETVLRTSMQSLAAAPLGAVSIDRLGNLYSTFSRGGQNPGVGGVFRLGIPGGATAFSFNGSDGNMPVAGVLLDSKQPTLYGTTEIGGVNDAGTVFKMVAPANESVLYSFCSQPSCADGSRPLASVIEDEAGNLYGTTRQGGVYNQGVAFEIVQSNPKQKASVWHAILPSKE
jgi:uncharacterized repeat protein (TIGR03803 family)